MSQLTAADLQRLVENLQTAPDDSATEAGFGFHATIHPHWYDKLTPEMILELHAFCCLPTCTTPHLGK
jgi:hypothetical protein